MLKQALISSSLFVSIFLRANCQDFRPPSNINYIAIKNGSISAHINPELFISTIRIHFPISESDTLGTHIDIKKWSPEKIDAFVVFNYYDIVTDQKSFSVLTSFICDSLTQRYFDSGKKSTHLYADDFSIILNGSQYNVYHKLRDKFLISLIKKLTSKKCDKIIIKTLRAYLPHLARE